jgi:hypothetical protein
MAKLSWNTPLANATETVGVITKSGSNSWTNCCNSTSNAETYTAGIDYDFQYIGDNQDASKNVQIGLYQGLITANNQIKYGFVITDVVYWIDQGVTSQADASPAATDTYHLDITSNVVKLIIKNSVGAEKYTKTIATAFAGLGWSHNSTMYYSTTYCSAEQDVSPTPSSGGTRFPPPPITVHI